MASFAFPASFAQERLWVIEQLTPGEPVYMHAWATRLRGTLDAAALADALSDVVARHEALRTRLELRDGALHQVIEPAAPVELRRLDAGGPEIAEQLSRETVDIGTGPVLRATLARIARDDHVLVLVMHHVAADGWSLGVMAADLEAAYAARRAGRDPDLPELEIQYADFATWQRDWLAGAELERHLAHWRERLAGAPPELTLATDRPRPAVQDHDGDAVVFTVDAALRQEVEAREGTPFMSVLAAWAKLLRAWSGQPEVVVVTPVSGRTRTEVEGVVGLFMNLLPLRVDGTFESAREATLDALSHQDLPFEKLVEELQPERDLARGALAQAMLVLQSAGTGTLALEGLECEPLAMRADMAPYDVTLELEDDGRGGWRAHLIYATALFERATAERMARQFVSALGTGDVLDERERRIVLHGFEDPRPDFVRGPLVPSLVGEVAAADPGRTAIVHPGGALSYAELDQRANALAHALVARGIGHEDIVGLSMERGPELVIAFLGVWRAGAAFVPLDPRAPAERNRRLLERCGARTVLEGVSMDRAPAPPAVTLDPRSLAYVIFTSGSTGEPKGVMVEHGGFLNMARFAVEAYAIDPDARFLNFLSPTFDGSLSEVFPTLMTGAELHLAAREQLLPGRALAGLMRERRISHTVVTPSALALLPDADLPDLRHLISCGEALPGETVDRWQPGRRFSNVYGPTEITAFCHGTEVRAGEGNPTIGRPMPNTRSYVLGRDLEPVPLGARGQLFVGTPGLARGYLGAPGLTAERFLPDPWAPGERMYATGDVVRMLPDGSLEFLGRADDQVKVRGFRVEPGEIEAAVLTHGGVEETVVVARDHRLLCFWSRREGAPEPDLRAHLAARLPSYMVPELFVRVDAFAHTPSGKVDRRSLPDVEPERGSAPYVAPSTPTERAVAEQWRHVLGIANLGTEDKFFEAGGNSLRLVELFERLDARFPGALNVAELFEHPTIAAMAAAIDRRTAAVPEPAGLVFEL
jgi:amino acid adenylation domain-containing protein